MHPCALIALEKANFDSRPVHLRIRYCMSVYVKAKMKYQFLCQKGLFSQIQSHINHPTLQTAYCVRGTFGDGFNLIVWLCKTIQ